MLLFQISLEEKFPIVGNRSSEEKIYDKQVREGMNKIGRVALDFIPLTYLPEMKNEMQKALDNKDKYAFMMAASQTVLYLGLDGVDALSLGSSKPITATARMAVKVTFKQRMKNIAKLVPEFKSTEIKKLDTHIDDVLDLIQKGKNQFPELGNALESSVKAIDYKDTSNVFSILNNKISNIPIEYQELFRSKHNTPVTVLTLDKGGMWASNGLDSSKAYGDIALVIYNQSISKSKLSIMKKFKDCSIDLIRTGSDEVITIINGPNKNNVELATNLFKEELNKNLNVVSGKMQTPFQDLFKKIDIQESRGKIYADSKFGFVVEGAHHKEKVYSLSEFSGRAETRKLFDEYIEKILKGNVEHSDLKYLRELSSTKPEVISLINKGEVIDGVVGYRAVLNKNSKTIFENITRINQKGVGAVTQNFVGPSVFNQVGHNFVDYLNSEYAESIILTAKKYNLNVKVSQSGPMQLAYKFDDLTDKETIRKVLEESEQTFLKSVKNIGISDVKAFYKSGTNYSETISKNVNADIVNYSRIINLEEETISNVNKIIAFSYTYKKFGKSTLDAFQQIQKPEIRVFVENLPDYVRNIDDLVQYSLEKNKSKDFIKEMLSVISKIY